MAEAAYTLEHNVLAMAGLNEGLGMEITFTPAN